MTLPLRPQRGGFLRPFGCGWFIREYMLGHGPNGSPKIDPEVGVPQADIFHHYKLALMKAITLDRATSVEEKRARQEKRAINPDNIEKLAKRYLTRMPYKAQGCRYHSFVVYFSNLTRLGWVKPTGMEESSEFQEHYPPGQPRRYFRLTETGKSVPDDLWADPRKALYG
ncbi:MAG TPA: hypothetical protein G4O12_07180 [Dehalococcoidia bacterium]|nr:hypothetical protein [Dehalococcoidia bacterium]